MKKHAKLHSEIHLHHIKFTYGVFIRAKKLCPTLFQNHHPDLIFFCWLGKQRMTVIAHRHVVIDHNFLVNSPEHDSRHVKAVWINLEGSEQVFYAEIILSEG
jgi:hypothetical protein